MPDTEAARVRERRLRDAIGSVRDAVVTKSSDHSVPDAVAGALDALYDLAEVFKLQGNYTLKDLDDRLAGDVGGETTLALVCARGAKTHALVDFGQLHTFGSHRYGEGPFGGGWAWQELADEEPRFARRSAWYSRHVRGHGVLDPLEVAHTWLAERLGLSPN